MRVACGADGTITNCSAVASGENEARALQAARIGWGRGAVRKRGAAAMRFTCCVARECALAGESLQIAFDSQWI